MEIVINYDKTTDEYKIYESVSKTLLLSKTLGDGFSNLNSFLVSEGHVKKSILEDENIVYHFDSLTFQEIIRSNINLMKRVNSIPSEFKNSANKFGMPSVPKNINSKNKQEFRGGGFGNKKSFSNSGNFGKSFGKFGNKKYD